MVKQMNRDDLKRSATEWWYRVGYRVGYATASRAIVPDGSCDLPLNIGPLPAARTALPLPRSLYLEISSADRTSPNLGFGEESLIPFRRCLTTRLKMRHKTRWSRRPDKASLPRSLYLEISSADRTSPNLGFGEESLIPFRNSPAGKPQAGLAWIRSPSA